MSESIQPVQGLGGDWIHLHGVEAICILGVHPAERIQPRKVRMDIALECDVRKAAETDHLEHAMNYELVEAEAVAIAKKGKFALIESLAERVADACLRHALVTAVRVVVEKPEALPLTKSVAVEILRRKPVPEPPPPGQS